MEVLTPQQLAALNQAKVRPWCRVGGRLLLLPVDGPKTDEGGICQVMIRMDNEQYLREHPDVNKVMRALVRGIIRERPANPTTFAYRFFSRSRAVIRQDLDAKD